jgi:hypothetical protein
MEIQQRFNCGLDFSYYYILNCGSRMCLNLVFLCQAAEGFSRKNSVPLDLVYRKVDG